MCFVKKKKRWREKFLGIYKQLNTGKMFTCSCKARIKVQIVLLVSFQFYKDFCRSSLLVTVLKTLSVNIPKQLHRIDAIYFSVCQVC